MGQIATQLTAFLKDSKPQVDSLFAGNTAILDEFADATKLAPRLRQRFAILTLRQLVDDGQLEEYAPYEEKTVKHTQIQQAIFDAIEAGLGEESELYVRCKSMSPP